MICKWVNCLEVLLRAMLSEDANFNQQIMKVTYKTFGKRSQTRKKQIIMIETIDIVKKNNHYKGKNNNSQMIKKS